MNEKKQMVELLVRYKANINLTNSFGVTPLSISVGDNAGIYGYSQPEVAHALLDAGADVNIRDEYNRGALSYACEHYLLPITERLIDLGAEPNHADSNRWTPLHYAATNDSYKLTELLIKAKADLKARNPNGESAYYIAATYWSFQSLHALREHKSNEPTWTDLHWAAIFNEEELARKTLTTEIEVNQQDCYGRTPLVWALYNNSPSVAKLLLQHGADSNLADKQNFSPFLAAVASETLEIVRMIKEKVNDIHIVDVDGWNALHFATRNDDTAMLEELIDYGLDIHHRDNEGSTLLHRAVLAEQTKTLALLLEKGVNPLITDYQGNDLLHGVDIVDRNDYEKIIAPYRVPLQEEIIEAVLAAREKGTIPEPNQDLATTPKEAIRQLIRALNRGETDSFIACFITNKDSKQLSEGIVLWNEASLLFRQGMINEYGKKAWVTMQSNGTGFAMTFPIIDEKVIDSIHFTKIDEETVTCKIPGFYSPDGMKLRKTGSVWKFDPKSILSQGATFDGMSKLISKLANLA